MIKKIRLCFGCTIIFIVACKHDKEIIPATDCSTIKYSTTIKPIIDAKCEIPDCHAGNPDTDDYSGYDQLAEHAQVGDLKKVIIDDKTMPPNGPLSQAEQTKILCWIKAGAPHN